MTGVRVLMDIMMCEHPFVPLFLFKGFIEHLLRAGYNANLGDRRRVRQS